VHQYNIVILHNQLTGETRQLLIGCFVSTSSQHGVERVFTDTRTTHSQISDSCIYYASTSLD